MWEILLNSDERRRDYLIYWAQFNCSESLLKSPTEIIINYLVQGCPQKDRISFFDAPGTQQQIGETWKKVHGKIDRTIPVDLSALKERSEAIRQLSKKLKSIVNDMCANGKLDDPFHQVMKTALKNLDFPENKENERIFKISLIFLFFIVCIGLELENKAVRDYWEKFSIDDPFDRLDYLVQNHPEILIRGPLLEMAKMAEVQIASDNGQGRGLVHDCFHAIYCYYADNFITGDAHFRVLRDSVPHPAFERIILTEQLEQIWDLTMQKIKAQEAKDAQC
ncbi:MAG: hypothetical protein DYH13_10535 [Alphaproteobacteria bacterium PRO2]|nr:hypothetical protein [Alphaproteobacteria bacterium PRO2]